MSNLDIIQSKGIELDSENLHLNIIKSIDNGEHDSYIEAILDYAEKNEIEITDLVKYISPTLKDIIYVEACSKYMIKEPNVSTIFDEL